MLEDQRRKSGLPASMQDQLRATKLWLQKQFKTSGIQLEPAALASLVDAVQDVEDPEAYVHSLIEEIEAGKSGGAGGAGVAGSGRDSGATGGSSWHQPAASSQRSPAPASLAPRHHSTLCSIQFSTACRPACPAASEDRRVSAQLLQEAVRAVEGRSAPQDVVQVGGGPGPAGLLLALLLLGRCGRRGRAGTGLAGRLSAAGPACLDAAPLPPVSRMLFSLPRAAQVIPAFNVPHVRYDPVRKLFHRSSEVPRLQADATVGRVGHERIRKRLPGCGAAQRRVCRGTPCCLSSFW